MNTSPAPARRTPATRWRGRWQALPLRTRLVAILVALVLLALTATGYGVQLILRHYLAGQVDTQLRTTYNLARTDPQSLHGLTDTDRDHHRQPGGPTQFVSHVSFDTKPELNQTIVPAGQDIPPFSDLTTAQAAAQHGEPWTLQTAEQSWRAVAIPTNCSAPTAQSTDALPPTATSGRELPCVVTVAHPLRDVDEATRQLQLLLVFVGAGVALACGITGWIAVRRAFRPLVAVEHTATAIAAGDYSQRIAPQPTTTEVGQLTESLNAMLTRIEEAFAARTASEQRTRQFAADASHELRTPLASIRGFAELYRQGAVPPEDVPRTLQRIEDEARRMGGLVEDLLMLARLDAQRPARHDPVDLQILAADAVHDAAALDPSRRIELVQLGNADPGALMVRGDEDRLRQVLTNLMSNAIRHTPGGTPIEVAAGTTGAGDTRRVVVEVRDHGPGISAEQREKIFERFYRVDSSRARATGGNGLGLSIAHAITTAHHGTLTAHPTPGGGMTFRMELPGTS